MNLRSLQFKTHAKDSSLPSGLIFAPLPLLSKIIYIISSDINQFQSSICFNPVLLSCNTVFTLSLLLTSCLCLFSSLQEHSSCVQMCLFFFITHESLILVDTETPRACVCVRESECVFLWSPSRCLDATPLIRQAEEKLGVFLLHRTQPLLRSCEQVPKPPRPEINSVLFATSRGYFVARGDGFQPGFFFN